MTTNLRTHVHVEDEHGHAHVFGPGDDVPAWAAEKITNPAAWEQESDEAEDKPVAPRGDKAPARRRTTKE